MTPTIVKHIESFFSTDGNVSRGIVKKAITSKWDVHFRDTNEHHVNKKKKKAYANINSTKTKYKKIFQKDSSKSGFCLNLAQLW